MPPDTAAGALSGPRPARDHRRRRGVDARVVAPGRRGRRHRVGRYAPGAQRHAAPGRRARRRRGGCRRDAPGSRSPSAPTAGATWPLEAHLISPWGTWEWIGPAALGARAAARGTVELGFDVAPPAVGGARRVVGADPGRLRGTACLLARGEGDGPMTMSPRPSPARRCCVSPRSTPAKTGCADRRLASSLPRRDTSEGRQLRRWLTQLLVTERVVAGEAETRRLTADGAPSRGRAAAGHHGPAGDRQRRGLGACRSAGQGAVRRASPRPSTSPMPTCTTTRERNPLRFGSTAEIADHLRGAARRRAFRLWLDARCAEVVQLAPGYEHPGDPRQPDNTHRH